MSITLILILLALGLLIGCYSGMIGTGGNVLLIPALDILFSYFAIPPNESVKLIIAHSLFVAIFTGVSVSYKQFKENNFFPREILAIALPGIITSFFTTLLIKNGHWYEKKYFDIVFLLVLTLIAARLLLSKNKKAENHQAPLHRGYLAILGAITGVLTSLSGLGGGVLIIPALTDLLGVPVKKASSISIGVVALFALPISVNYLFANQGATVHQILPWQWGYISMAIVLPVTVGIFITAPMGVSWAHKMKQETLRLILGTIIVLLSAKILYGLLFR